MVSRCVLAEVDEHMMIVDPGNYQRERGNEFQITDSSNGNQWSTGHAFSRETARKLRDTLTALLLEQEVSDDA